MTPGTVVLPSPDEEDSRYQMNHLSNLHHHQHNHQEGELGVHLTEDHDQLDQPPEEPRHQQPQQLQQQQLSQQQLQQPQPGPGPIQLWQFLLELLSDPTCQHFISWTGNGWEFKMADPDEASPTKHFSLF